MDIFDILENKINYSLSTNFVHWEIEFAGQILPWVILMDFHILWNAVWKKMLENL